MVFQKVRLTCVYDCCHSGTMTDLAVTAGLDDEGEASAGGDGASRGIKSRVMTPPAHIRDILQNQNALKQPKKQVKAAAHRKYLWTLSGFQDNQTSAAACIQGIKQGAMTWSLHYALQHCKYDLTYEELLHMMRKKAEAEVHTNFFNVHDCCRELQMQVFGTRTSDCVNCSSCVFCHWQDEWIVSAANAARSFVVCTWQKGWLVSLAHAAQGETA